MFWISILTCLIPIFDELHLQNNRKNKYCLHFTIHVLSGQQLQPNIQIKQEPGTVPVGTMKNALLEDQDISPDSIKNILPQTEDQDFFSIEPPISLDDYLFSMDNNEGISDLFDAYDFDIPVHV